MTGGARRAAAAPVAAALLLAAGCAAGGTAAAPAPGGTAPGEPAVATASPRPPEPVPVRVRVPRLGVDAALDPLHLGPAGELDAPAYGRAGWYEDGPEPGEPGRAVIAGHVDSVDGPDVFAGLSRARAGDRIEVGLSDGSRVRFAVRRVGLYPKDEFPTARVYGGPRKVPELRLITCGGPYERSRGGYQGNWVVFAAAL